MVPCTGILDCHLLLLLLMLLLWWLVWWIALLLGLPVLVWPAQVRATSRRAFSYSRVRRQSMETIPHRQLPARLADVRPCVHHRRWLLQLHQVTTDATQSVVIRKSIVIRQKPQPRGVYNYQNLWKSGMSLKFWSPSENLLEFCNTWKNFLMDWCFRCSKRGCPCWWINAWNQIVLCLDIQVNKMIMISALKLCSSYLL